MLKIANVALGNSDARRRLHDWLTRRCPDIVTLQKIGRGDLFPESELRDAGYQGCFLHHDENRLGVAVLARREFLDHRNLSLSRVLYPELPDADICEPRFPNESRFLTASIGDLWVSSVYAPYGPASLPKREAIERRVAWLNRLRVNFRIAGRDRWLLCGDFNVKPDGGPPWKGYYSQDERDALDELMKLGLCDLYREAHPHPERRPGHTRGFGARYPYGTSRLHLVLASESLARRLRSARMDPDSSLWPRSDAPPVVVELDDN